LGYAHYYIDKDTIVRVDHTYNKAWHTGNNDGNANYLGYEVVESFYGVISDAEFIENENMTLRQAAEDLAYYGLPVNRDTVRLHNEFKATSCPHRSWDIHVGKGKSYTSANKNIMKDYFISKIKAYQKLGKTVQEMLKNEGVKGTVKVETPKATGTHKVVKGDTLWDIAIKYNTSVSNIKSLNNLKSDLINIGQVLKVNGIVKSVTETIKKPATVKKPAPAKKTKSIAQMAQEVIANKHGNGHDIRRKSLGISAAEYEKVRAEVNRQSGVKAAPVKPKKTIDQMAKEIINNPKVPKGHKARQKWLGIDNATYQKVRARVNQIL